MRRPWPNWGMLRLGKKWISARYEDLLIELKETSEVLLGNYPSQVAIVKTISWLMFMGLMLLHI